MTVDVARLDGHFNGLAGFRFAAKGEIKSDYRHNVMEMHDGPYEFGFDAGLNSNGSLVLDNQSVPAAFPLGSWQRLHMLITPNGANHDVTLELIDPDTSAVLASVSKSIPSASILGNIDLLSHSSASGSWGSPVCAFRNWTYTGTNLAGSDAQNWGPILFVQYTLSRGTLKLSSQFAPLASNENRVARLEIDVGNGWTEGVQLMQEGGKSQLVIPPGLAYGDKGELAGQVLIFEIELISVGAPPASQPTEPK